jgi:hypothetical protein
MSLNFSPGYTPPENILYTVMQCDDCPLLLNVVIYTGEEMGPVEGVGSQGMLSTLAGLGGNRPYGAVQHRHGT